MFSKFTNKLDRGIKHIKSMNVPLVPTIIVGVGAVIVSGLLGQRAGMTVVRNYYNCLVLDERAIVAAAALATGAVATVGVIMTSKSNTDSPVVGNAPDENFYSESNEASA